MIWMASKLFLYVCVFWKTTSRSLCWMKERIVVVAVAKRKKNERELWKSSLKCVCAAPSPSLAFSLYLSYTHNVYDTFWNSIKNECVWHNTSERKCVKRNEKEETKRKWANHTSLFKHLTSWSIVQCSLLRLVCFSLLWFPPVFYSRLRMNTSIYCTSLRASKFIWHSTTSLSRIVCLRQWLFFHFQKMYVCMFNHETATSEYCESSNTLFAYSPNESYVNFRTIECARC
jgi:hypothetical protein